MNGLGAAKIRFAALATVIAFGVVTAVAGAALVSLTATSNTALGKILSSGGKTLYQNSSESKTSIKCLGACAKEWPPLLITSGAKAIAGPGAVSSLIGSVKRPDGKMQVTYRGKPLYLYSGDKKAGDVKGQGLSGIWHATAPSGVAVTKSAVSSSSSSSSTGYGSSSSSSSSSSNSSSSSSNVGGSTAQNNNNGLPADCATNPQASGCM